MKQLAKTENRAPEKKKKSSGSNKTFLSKIVFIPKRIGNTIQNTIAELKKVTWPSFKDLVNYTGIVLAFMVTMAIVVGMLDLGATELISLIIQR